MFDNVINSYNGLVFLFSFFDGSFDIRNFGFEVFELKKEIN